MSDSEETPGGSSDTSEGNLSAYLTKDGQERKQLNANEHVLPVINEFRAKQDDILKRIDTTNDKLDETNNLLRTLIVQLGGSIPTPTTEDRPAISVEPQVTHNEPQNLNKLKREPDQLQLQSATPDPPTPVPKLPHADAQLYDNVPLTNVETLRKHFAKVVLQATPTPEPATRRPLKDIQYMFTPFANALFVKDALFFVDLERLQKFILDYVTRADWFPLLYYIASKNILDTTIADVLATLSTAGLDNWECFCRHVAFKFLISPRHGSLLTQFREYRPTPGQTFGSFLQGYTELLHSASQTDPVQDFLSRVEAFPHGFSAIGMLPRQHTSWKPFFEGALRYSSVKFNEPATHPNCFGTVH